MDENVKQESIDDDRKMDESNKENTNEIQSLACISVEGDDRVAKDSEEIRSDTNQKENRNKVEKELSPVSTQDAREEMWRVPSPASTFANQDHHKVRSQAFAFRDLL